MESSTGWTTSPWRFGDTVFQLDIPPASRIRRMWDRVPKESAVHKGRKVWKRPEWTLGASDQLQEEAELAQPPGHGAKRQRLKQMPALPAKLGRSKQYVQTSHDETADTPKRKAVRRRRSSRGSSLSLSEQEGEPEASDCSSPKPEPSSPHATTPSAGISPSNRPQLELTMEHESEDTSIRPAASNETVEVANANDANTVTERPEPAIELSWSPIPVRYTSTNNQELEERNIDTVLQMSPLEVHKNEGEATHKVAVTPNRYDAGASAKCNGNGVVEGNSDTFQQDQSLQDDTLMSEEEFVDEALSYSPTLPLHMMIPDRGDADARDTSNDDLHNTGNRPEIHSPDQSSQASEAGDDNVLTHLHESHLDQSFAEEEQPESTTVAMREAELIMDEVEGQVKRTRSGARFSDDTTVLKDFLNRAQARKAALALQAPPTSPVRTSPRRSPRKVLGNLDHNSPSPTKPKHRSRGRASSSGKSPAKLLETSGEDEKQSQADNTEDQEKDDGQAAAGRSGRTKPAAPSKVAAGAPNFISLRRTKGPEPVVLKRSHAQELAAVTRGNTRRNKGKAMMPFVMLKLNLCEKDAAQSPIKKASKATKSKKGKKVDWDEKLVYYHEEKKAEAGKEERKARTRRPKTPTTAGSAAATVMAGRSDEPTSLPVPVRRSRGRG